jgi:pilus assembly protein CpaF
MAVGVGILRRTSQDHLQHLEDELRKRLVADYDKWRSSDNPLPGSKRWDSEISKARARALAGAAIRSGIPSADESICAEVAAEIVDDLLGYGPVEQFLEDPAVSEVMINGPFEVWIERDGCLEPTGARFRNAGQLRSFIERVIGPLGLRIDDSSPIVDARLPDGSRFHAVLGAVARGGPVVTIRKFSRKRFGIDDLVETGALSQDAANFLAGAVRGRANIVISGGTSTGKTTLLNVLSSLIESGERIITVEDAAELQLQQEHVISLESRPANSDGVGEVTLGELVRAALRMRPDRIILGEARGSEALYMLQAMNTGHEGSLATVHANSPSDAFLRIETMTLMANLGLSVEAVRMQISSAIDLVVQLSRGMRGKRFVTSISYVDDDLEWPHLIELFCRRPDKSASCSRQGSLLTQVSDTRPFLQRLARRSPRSLEPLTTVPIEVVAGAGNSEESVA